MKKYSKIKEIGDKSFPLEVNLIEDLNVNHSHVGKIVEVSPHANELLSKYRGDKAKILGVFTKNNQIAGYKVKVKGKTLHGPKKDFYLDKSFSEDIFLNSSKAQEIRNLLSHWDKQHDYYSDSWQGIEFFHFNLAKSVDLIAIESGGWISYPSSKRDSFDGKTWRYVVSSKRDPVVISASSCLHDHVWTLNTTVFSTREIDQSKLTLVGHSDHWTRALLWTMKLAEVLSTDEVDFTDVIKRYRKRIQLNLSLRKEVDLQLKKILPVYCKTTGHNNVRLNPLSVGFSRTRIPGRAIGCHDKPTDLHPYSILTIKPSALRDPSYLEEVVKHELIHYVCHHHPENNVMPHGKLFKEMAKALKLPKKYQD